MENEDFDAVIRCERALLDPAVRADALRLDALLHAEFEEIGSAGQLWDRASIIRALVRSPEVDDALASEFVCRNIEGGNILLTYLLSSDSRTTRRSSIWVEAPHGWVVRFHQGTLVA